MPEVARLRRNEGGEFNRESQLLNPCTGDLNHSNFIYNESNLKELRLAMPQGRWEWPCSLLSAFLSLPSNFPGFSWVLAAECYYG